MRKNKALPEGGAGLFMPGALGRNLFTYPLGAIGRDFFYQFYNGFLLSFILFTKSLTPPQFAAASIIIIAIRAFDALSAPIMGGIVENTISKFGRFKPWILLGALLSGAVLIAIFTTPLKGWSFVAFFAGMFLLLNLTYTMNDIAYWSMLPSLSKNEFDRGRLTSFAQLCGGLGSGACCIAVPLFTVGKFTLGGSAVSAYNVIAVAAAFMMSATQLITFFGVKEPENYIRRGEKLTLKAMFKTIAKNDQLLWAAAVLLLFNVGAGVVGGGLSLTYIYFEFGYNGILNTAFGVCFAISMIIFTVLFPKLCKKFGRDNLVKFTCFCLILGYTLMLAFGLLLPSDMKTVKFIAITVCNGIVGLGHGFFMIMSIYLAGAIEYNEWRYGTRDEGLIFSFKPLTSKLGSALIQLIVMFVYLIVGVTSFTESISNLENLAAMGAIDGAEKLIRIENIIQSVPRGKITLLLILMCALPIAFSLSALIIYRKKCVIGDEEYRKILCDINLGVSPAALGIKEGDKIKKALRCETKELLRDSAEASPLILDEFEELAVEEKE